LNRITDPHQVKMMKVNTGKRYRSEEHLLQGEIHDVEVYFHTIPEGETVLFEWKQEYARAFFLLDGSGTFEHENNNITLVELALFVPSYKKSTKLTSLTDIHMLEIRRLLNEDDIKELKNCKIEFPIVRNYVDCVKYTDRSSSAKSIKRSVLEQHIIPRFAMGTCETYGQDHMKVHSHPLLDQFLFSFAENEIVLIIDDIKIPMEGNTIIHIPLGAEHGVEIAEGKHMHYIWMDFMEDEQGALYLDKSHKLLP